MILYDSHFEKWENFENCFPTNSMLWVADQLFADQQKLIFQHLNTVCNANFDE